jgi:hypothetical protein
MMTSGKMFFQMRRRSAAIMRNENAIVCLAPQKNIRIKNSQWQVVKIANSNYVNGINSAGVVAEDVTPQRTPYVFIEYIKEWHRSGRLRTLLGFEAFSQFNETRGGGSASLEVFHSPIIPRDKLGDLGLVLKVISNGAINLRKCQRRVEIDNNRLGRMALVISRGNINETEAVALEAYFACGVTLEDFWQGTHRLSILHLQGSHCE